MTIASMFSLLIALVILAEPVRTADPTKIEVVEALHTHAMPVLILNQYFSLGLNLNPKMLILLEIMLPFGQSGFLISVVTILF